MTNTVTQKTSNGEAAVVLREVIIATSETTELPSSPPASAPPTPPPSTTASHKKQKKTRRGQAPANAEEEPINDIEFDSQIRGYNRRQVGDYIDALSKDYNAICEKCTALEAENEGLRRALVALNLPAPNSKE